MTLLRRRFDGGQVTVCVDAGAIGAATGESNSFAMRIGSRVSIGAIAVIVARSNRTVTIGDGAVIGANSTVTHDVPLRTVVVGSPAEVLGRAAETGTE